MSAVEWTDAEREAVTYRLVHHYRVGLSNGECLCGHKVPLGHSFTAHQADEALNALSDLVAARIDEVRARVTAESERSTTFHDIAVDNGRKYDAAIAERDELAETLRLRSETLDRVVARAEAAEAAVEVLRAALNVALNSDDQEALEGARMALQEVRDEDLELLIERDALRATVARVEALADRWQREEMPDPTTADRDLRAALAGESDGQ